MAGSHVSKTALGIAATAVLHLAVAGTLVHFDGAQATPAAASVMVTLMDSAGEKPLAPPPKPKPQPKIVKTSPSRPQPAPVAATPAPMAPPAEPAVPDVANAAPAPAASITLPRFNADYLNNPPPVYPPVSRRLGEAGRVVLRVVVRADGIPSEVAVNRSSGSARLDQAALDAVRLWRFVPARRGETPVEAPVLVPISFSLQG